MFFARERESFFTVFFSRTREETFWVFFPRLFWCFCAFWGVFLCFWGVFFCFWRVSAEKKIGFIFCSKPSKAGNSRSGYLQPLSPFNRALQCKGLRPAATDEACPQTQAHRVGGASW